MDRTLMDWQHTVFLHNAEELDNDFGAWSDQYLTLSRLLGVVDGVERIVEDRGLNHFEYWEILKSSDGSEVSVEIVY